MQKIAKDQLLPPGICTLCEGAPVEGQEVVDTLKELVTGFPFKLAGRRYVCDSCVISLGNVVGLVSSDQHDRAVERAEKAEAQLVAVQDHVAKFANQFSQAALESVSAVVVEPVVEEAPVETPTKKKKAADDAVAPVTE